MNFPWTTAALVALITCIGASADTFLKLASAQPRPFWNGWFLLGMLSSSAFAIVWMLLMQSMKLATAGVVCAISSALLLVCIGITFFGERLSIAESTGVAMALIAMVLLGRINA